MAPIASSRCGDSPIVRFLRLGDGRLTANLPPLSWTVFDIEA